MSIATEKIEKQIKTIAVLYFAFAGFSFLMLMLLPLHYMMFRRFSTMGFPVPEGQPDPMEMMAPMMDVMIYFYIVMGVLGVLFVISTFLTGLLMLQKKNRTVCIIGAAIGCLSAPLGTALGIWALLTLFDNKTKLLFETPVELNDPDFRN
ncbi:MAG: hypothetical protein K0U86_01270 [Planctomycetes bacterium]|nr:hypothetical protein [Planctomycetota bacterium]MCH9723516.1 hypothetical protein [Planctomycetota bacterium]MCH9775309.1 hypothetical protein [Planctomycetota bacterium]MCH9790672.1 hypothetical protein [Planctomycetota bacterium]